MVDYYFPISGNASRNGQKVNKKDQLVHFQLQEKNFMQMKWKLPRNCQMLEDNSASAGYPCFGTTQVNQQKRADTCSKIKWHKEKIGILYGCWGANTFCPHASLQLCEMSSMEKQYFCNYAWENHMLEWDSMSEFRLGIEKNREVELKYCSCTSAEADLDNGQGGSPRALPAKHTSSDSTLQHCGGETIPQPVSKSKIKSTATDTTAV